MSNPRIVEVRNKPYLSHDFFRWTVRWGADNLICSEEEFINRKCIIMYNNEVVTYVRSRDTDRQICQRP